VAETDVLSDGYKDDPSRPDFPADYTYVEGTDNGAYEIRDGVVRPVNTGYPVGQQFNNRNIIEFRGVLGQLPPKTDE